MIKIEKAEVMGWEHVIRGMRNPMNSWDKSDSGYCCGDKTCRVIPECDLDCDIPHYIVGPNDHDLMMRLAKAGPVDGKFRRMIAVYVDITAPLYWWKEFDTYKVGTVANSCSTMHKIHAKEFTLSDFSHEHLDYAAQAEYRSVGLLEATIRVLNHWRDTYLAYNAELKTDLPDEIRKKRLSDQKYAWWQMIQLLPSSYNQKRTVMLNYEVLANIYQHRRFHKLDEWRELCKWIEGLPYSEIITGNPDKE